ncbi:hypothetical protein EVA_13210 [gut metagenome]|uniref:Uncharacterized protein n=1 Tax=gut metagenome TaxID=749906 RepID=J9GH11_9ZZZZ
MGNKLCNICHFIQTKFNSRAFSWNWFWQGDSVYPIRFEAPDCNGLNYIFSCKVMAIVRNLQASAFTNQLLFHSLSKHRVCLLK